MPPYKTTKTDVSRQALINSVQFARYSDQRLKIHLPCKGHPLACPRKGRSAPACRHCHAEGNPFFLNDWIKNMRRCMSQIPSKFKKLSFFTLFFISLIASPASAEDVILTWDRPDDVRVTGYEIYYGPAENDDFKSSPKEIIRGPEQTTCDIMGLMPGETYAFAAKSFDDFRNKSEFSEVIFYAVPHEQNNNQDDNSDGDNNNSDQGDNTDDSKKDDDGQSNNSANNAGGGGGGCFIHLTLNPVHEKSL